MKKGIIFDVDGTLWDSSVQVAKSWTSVTLPEMGKTITPEDISRNMGKTMDAIAADLFSELPVKEQLALLKRCMEVENRYLETHPGTLYPGVRETMELLSRCYGLYIVSNCQCGYIEVLLRSCNLEEFIQDTECFGNTGLQKGDNIRMLMERNHLDSCFYVGDTQMDAQASEMAGIPFVFASYGFGTAKKAVAVIERFEQLTGMAKRMFGEKNT